MSAEFDLQRFLHQSRYVQRSGVFRICHQHGVGYIHLRAGEIIHASNRELSGNQALRKILSWNTDISIDACNSPLSAVVTVHHANPIIDTDTDDRAASNDRTEYSQRTASDNRAEAAVENHIQTHTTEPMTATGPIDAIRSVPREEPNMPDDSRETLVPIANNNSHQSPFQSREQASNLAQFQPESSDPERRPWNLLTRDCEAAVGMSPDGDILFSHGNADDLADVTALAARLAQLTAEALGMEEVIAMECSGENESYFIYRATTGEQVALKPKANVSLRSIKAALDL